MPIMSRRQQRGAARDEPEKEDRNTRPRLSARSASTANSAVTSAKIAPVKQSLSLADQAYASIKDLIITCVLRPGDYINESQLCERLKIGRTPVHQAVGQLQQERFVDIIPRKGIIVRPISLDEYFALDETRLLLEVGAARFSAERITSSELQVLDAIVDRVKEARRDRNIEMLLLCDRDFHFCLADATRNPILATMLKTTYERSLRVWFMSLATMTFGEPKHGIEQIIHALRERDADEASRLIREHVLSSRSYTMRNA